jgi:MFS family permease
VSDREPRAERPAEGAVSATGDPTYEEGYRSTEGPTYEEEYRARPTDVSGSSRRGLNIPATLAGMLTALGSLVLLAGILSAILGAIGYQVGLKGNAQELSVGSAIAGAVALFIAFLIGGWAAARIARYRGPLHGVLTAVWFIVLAAVLAALGAWFGAEYNVFKNLALPQWFSADALTIGAIISGLVAIAIMLLGGWLGGRLGDRHDSDAVTISRGENVRVREGGLATERDGTIR